MKLKLILPIALLSSLALISCGGGGGGDDGVVSYSGSTSEATITVDNAADLAVAATGGVAQGIAADSAPSLRPSPGVSALLEHSSQFARMMSTANRTANQLVEGVCSSGSADMTHNQEGTEFTVVYSNCVLLYGNGQTANGTFKFVQNADESFSFQYINFTMTYMGEVYTLNMTVECDATFACSWITDYAGPDGRTYRVEGASAYNYSGDSYIVTATVYDPDHGSITIDADVTYGSCAGGVPITGSISYTASGSTWTVTFNDCNSFTVTDGVSYSEIFYWADYL